EMLQKLLANKRILIVDDNATNRQILSLHTSSWGMIPRAAASGPEAIGWIGSGEPFDIAVIDMQMPMMDGMMLATNIRNYRDAESLPMVMLSSLDRREALELSEGASGADRFKAFLTKPVKSLGLRQTLASALAGGNEQSSNSEEEAAVSFSRTQPQRILLAEAHRVNQHVGLLFPTHTPKATDSNH